MGEDERLGGGKHRDALGDERIEQFGRNVFVVEGQRVRAGRDPPQRLQIGVGSDHHVGADLSGRITGVGREHPQALTEGDGGLVRHPGQLPATHHRYLRHGAHAAMTAALRR